MTGTWRLRPAITAWPLNRPFFSANILAGRDSASGAMCCTGGNTPSAPTNTSPRLAYSSKSRDGNWISATGICRRFQVKTLCWARQRRGSRAPTTASPIRLTCGKSAIPLTRASVTQPPNGTSSGGSMPARLLTVAIPTRPFGWARRWTFRWIGSRQNNRAAARPAPAFPAALDLVVHGGGAGGGRPHPVSFAEFSARTRRRRIRLCRPAHAAGHPALPTRLQHEVSRHVCGLCGHHGVVRPDSGGHSYWRAVHDDADGADAFPAGQTNSRLDGRD